jgi:Xaa-Pro aminopeptidase
MKEAGVDALLLSEITNVAWATGFKGSTAWALVLPEGGRFFTDSRYTLAARDEVQELPSFTFASPKTSSQFLKEQLAEAGVQKLWFESEFVTYANYESWKRAFAPVELLPAKDLVGPLRLIKTAEEIEAIKRACRLTDACFEHVLRMIQPGVVEYDIGLEIEFYFRRNGADLAFAPAVVSGHRSARPHGKPSEKKLEPGDFVTLDFGAKVDGYCADITRTLVVAEASERHKEIYNQVLKAQLASIEAMKPGVPAKDVDGIARQVLGEKDLAQYFGHGLGHGLGRAVHDGGRMGVASDNVLEPGQVWTVEPGVYIEGFGGVRIEDDVVVTESGVELLTHSPKDLMVLPA